MLGLASLYCLRMLGLFMVLPLFAVYAQELAGANAASIGLALGAYGLTQAAFQVPLGWLSDQVGRKPVIVGGLCFLVLGSVLAALADTLTSYSERGTAYTEELKGTMRFNRLMRADHLRLMEGEPVYFHNPEPVD